MPANRRVAIIDDSAEVRQLIEDLLREVGPYEAEGFDGSGTTLDDIEQMDPAAVILEIHLQEDDRGWHLLQALRKEGSMAGVPVIICTADTAQLRDRRDELATLPGIFVLEKPFTLESLEQLVNCAMQAAAGRSA